MTFRIWPPRDYHTDPLIYIDGFWTWTSDGTFSNTPAIGRYDGLTLEQLQKFVVMLSKWHKR